MLGDRTLDSKQVLSNKIQPEKPRGLKRATVRSAQLGPSAVKSEHELMVTRPSISISRLMLAAGFLSDEMKGGSSTELKGVSLHIVPAGLTRSHQTSALNVGKFSTDFNVCMFGMRRHVLSLCEERDSRLSDLTLCLLSSAATAMLSCRDSLLPGEDGEILLNCRAAVGHFNVCRSLFELCTGAKMRWDVYAALLAAAAAAQQPCGRTGMNLHYQNVKPMQKSLRPKHSGLKGHASKQPAQLLCIIEAENSGPRGSAALINLPPHPTAATSTVLCLITGEFLTQVKKSKEGGKNLSFG